MDSFPFELVSPEKLLISEDVQHVVVPGVEGEFGVLAHHAPFMSTLRPGIVQVYKTEGGAPERLFVRGGFADVNPAIASAEATAAALEDGQLKIKAQTEVDQLRELRATL
jgi:F-type H+-transporting ATPase subunit epsilon